jgi:hypothetical protein
MLSHPTDMNSSKHTVNMIGIPPEYISTCLWALQVDADLKDWASIAFPECVVHCALDKLCSVEIRVKEHHHYIWLNHLEKLPMSEHTINLIHRFLLNDSSILIKKFRQIDRIIREGVEIKLYRKNTDRYDEFSLNRLLKFLTNTLKEW